MKSSFIALASALVLSLGVITACGDDDDGGGGTAGKGGTGGGTGATGGTGGGQGGSSGGGGTAGGGGTGGGNIPVPPTLGAQIDRMGRPAINTALNKVAVTDDAVKQAGKDAYNQDATSSGWPAAYAAEFAGNLAVFDALDTVCGNQLLYTPSDAGSPYGTFAGALSNDWLIVDTTKTTCGYLGVETPILGLGAEGTCGGRKLEDDVIDLSYSGLAAGVSGFPGGVPAIGDTIDNDSTFLTTFPYLAAPN
jgi:hypothetical protein